MRSCTLPSLVLCTALIVRAAPAAIREPAPAPGETIVYGADEANTLIFWRAQTMKPAPLVVFFHGTGGDGAQLQRDIIVRECLEAGVSFAAVSFRDVRRGATFPEALRDCARAIQFLRAQAATLNVDAPRIAAYGRSLGASASLWLAFHDDMADPQNPDPVLRQSTRVACAGSFSGQFSLDPYRWTEVFGAEVIDRFASEYQNPRLWGFATIEDLHTAAGQKVRADCDIIALITRDDPPVFLVAHRPDALTSVGEFVHHPRLTQRLYERCQEVGVPGVADIPALGLRPSPGEPATWCEFALRRLREDSR